MVHTHVWNLFVKTVLRTRQYSPGKVLLNEADKSTNSSCAIMAGPPSLVQNTGPQSTFIACVSPLSCIIKAL